MPVIVEASLTPSRWQIVLDLLPLVFALILVAFLHYFLILPWLAGLGLWVWYQARNAESEFRYLRFAGERMLLWQGDQPPAGFQWFGQGWRTPLFIRWTLIDDNGLKLTFYLWRDSVSNVSWRALNMAFRVNSSLVKAQ